MSTFHSNIITLYGEKGKAWINAIPRLVEQIALRLGLRDLQPMDNLTYNYVLSGVQTDTPIVLKLGYDYEALNREYLALKCFAGCGAVNVIASEKGFLVLEKVIPGISLKIHFPHQDAETVEIISHLMQKLHHAPIPKEHQFPHIKD